MPRYRLLSVALVLLAVPASAQARPVCGPSGTKTLAHNQHARVYVQAGVARGCHRDARHTYRLGLAKPIKRLSLASGYVAVRRSVAGGESLRVYNLRHRRTVGSVWRQRKFNLVKLDPEGVVIAHATRPDGRGVLVASGRRAPLLIDQVDDIGVKGGINGYRVGRDVTLFDAEADAGPIARLASSGTIMRVGDVRITVDDFTVSARQGKGPSFVLGRPQRLDSCDYRGGCVGWSYVSVYDDRILQSQYDLIGHWGITTAFALATGQPREVCAGDPHSRVTTESGRVACGQSGRTANEIVSEGVVLDAGPGVDPTSLARRGDELVWLHDGAERTAPLPR